MKKVFSILIVFVLAFCLTIPAFAYNVTGSTTSDEILEIMQEKYDEGYKYFTAIYKNNDGRIWLFQSTKPFEQNNVNGYLVATDSLSYVRYTWTGDSSNYYYIGNSPGTLAANQEPASTRVVIYGVSYDIYDNEGNLVMEGDDNFFPQPPLAELVLEVTEGELVEVTIPNLVGALKILVPCGVGLMALLVGLKLFGKRSLISRS